MTDLSRRQRDYAIYLPAISSFYARQLRSIANDPSHRVPAGFEKGYDGMNFLDENSYFYYPYGLYSAGHATLDLQKTDDDEPMVQKRDRKKTRLVGDSGGFQIASGVIKLDWSNALDPNDPERNKLCEKILRWLEHTSDWSMTLDVPPFACVAPYNKHTGLKEIQDTLDISMLNLDYFVRNRVPGATKFLNVLSGTNAETGQWWYDSVKCFSDEKFVTENYGPGRRLEGFAFAGINARDMSAVLTRLANLIDDGLLQKTDWIHVLGTGQLTWACHLTSLQREIRKHYNPNFTFSFDAASPFVNTAYGRTYAFNQFQPGRFGYFMDFAFDNQQLKNSDLPAPFAHSPIMSRLTMGDLCPMAAGDLDKNGKAKISAGMPICDKDGNPKLDAEGNVQYAERDSTSWDSTSYLLYMSHSVYNHIDAVQEANRLTDVEMYRKPVTYMAWAPKKKQSKSGEVSPYVPVNILMFRTFAEEFLDPNNKNRLQMIKDYADFIEDVSIAGDYEEGGTSKEVKSKFFKGL